MAAIGVGIGVIVASFWTMTELVKASAEQAVDSQRPSTGLPVSVAAEDAPSGSVSATPVKNPIGESPAQAAAPFQGPALIVPEEMVAMFQQRKLDLERREQAVRTAEGQLALLKAEVEQILRKVEAVEQRRLGQEKVVSGKQAPTGKQAVDQRTQQLAQLAKMYESMPPEEAAARLERMADRKALDILRLLKTKSAGAILSQVKADRAAKLSEEFLTVH
jgi:flagellar motility protein MotE (MotC chaperone)